MPERTVLGRVFDATVEWYELAKLLAHVLLVRDARPNRDALKNIPGDQFRNGSAGTVEV